MYLGEGQIRNLHCIILPGMESSMLAAVGVGTLVGMGSKSFGLSVSFIGVGSIVETMPMSDILKQMFGK